MPHFSARRMGAFAAVLLASACGSTAPPRTALVPNATVVRVVDGDTVRARVDGREETIRLIGIDTPETVKPNTPVQCFGEEASRQTKSLLPARTAVRLERDAEARDDYGRLLAYVYRAGDGLFVNLSLAREGYAVPLTIPPNVAHAREFVAAAADARRDGRGLWAACR
jgi:endonuclease YncB( thermonuclease family)